MMASAPGKKGRIMDSEDSAKVTPGTTTIAPGVLLTIARLTTLGVRGVHDLARVPAGVNRLFRRGVGEGVVINIDDNSVSVELHLILEQDTNVREVSRKVQMEVARAIEELVGMQVEHIDVHIEDIRFEDMPSP
jgi:uncharacterized alkaline shock family protein YloU